MAKLGIFYEQDDEGKDTGRVQVAEEEEEIVFDTFDTEEEAETYRVKLQAEFDMKDKIEEEYLEWERGVLSRHEIDQEELRNYLINAVL